MQALTEELAGERAVTAASDSELKAKAKQELAELQDELERKRTQVYLVPCMLSCWVHTCTSSPPDSPPRKAVSSVTSEKANAELEVASLQQQIRSLRTGDLR